MRTSRFVKVDAHSGHLNAISGFNDVSPANIVELLQPRTV
jgi:hypothetical protein